jgi:hypothetical protein
LTGTPVAVLILLEPSFQIKPIKCHPLFAHRDFSNIRAHLGVEPVAVHAEKAIRFLQSDYSRL